MERLAMSWPEKQCVGEEEIGQLRERMANKGREERADLSEVQWGWSLECRAGVVRHEDRECDLQVSSEESCVCTRKNRKVSEGNGRH